MPSSAFITSPPLLLTKLWCVRSLLHGTEPSQTQRQAGTFIEHLVCTQGIARQLSKGASMESTTKFQAFQPNSATKHTNFASIHSHRKKSVRVDMSRSQKLPSIAHLNSFISISRLLAKKRERWSSKIERQSVRVGMRVLGVGSELGLRKR